MTHDHDHDRLDPALQALVAELRRPASPRPGFDGRVMAAVATPARGPFAWLLEPVTLRVRPAMALALGVGLVAIGALALGPRSTAEPPMAAAAAEPAVPLVRFVIAAPEAGTVNLVGTFNDWDATATPLTPTGEAGVWTVEIPLAPGRHEYAFVVDGREWRPDPAAPASTLDEFGSPNSVITVAGRS